MVGSFFLIRHSHWKEYTSIYCIFFLFPGSERWPRASWSRWSSWSQRIQSEWVCHTSGPGQNYTMIVFVFLFFNENRYFRESAWLSWAVIPVSITGLPICLKCCYDCYSKHWPAKEYCYCYHNLAKPYWWSYRVAFIPAERKCSTRYICRVFVYSWG